MDKGLLFTYTLTYGGAAASLYNPFAGLLVYVIFAIVKPESMWFWSVPEGNYSRIVAIALLVGWAMRGFGSWKFGRARPVAGFLLAFWGWSVVAATQAPHPDVAWGFVEAISKIVLPVIVGLTTVTTVARLQALVWTVVLSQAYVAFEFNMSYLGGFNRLWEIGFGGMDNNCNAIALVTALGVTVFLGYRATSWVPRLVAFGSAALMLHAILFSFSRGGMLGAIMTGAVAFRLISKRPKHYLALALVALLAVRLAGPEVQKRFLTAFEKQENLDSSAKTRLELWGKCVEAMEDDPLFGVGPEHWHIAVKERFGWPTGQEAHNLWLQTGAELGVPGALFLACFYGTCVWRLWPVARSKPGEPGAELSELACGVIAGLVGFAVSATFVSIERVEIPYYVALIGAGILRQLPEPPPETPPD